MSSSLIIGGYTFIFENASDASAYTFHVCHAYLFPFPRKADTASQPVKAWKKGMPFDVSDSKR